MKKTVISVLAGISIACCMFAVGCSEHNFSSEWSSDDTYHYHACTDDGCNEVSDKAEHNYQLSGTVNTCTVCAHSYDTSSTYEVNVTTLGGTVLSAVDVKLYDANNTEIATQKTNVRGKARFRDVTPGDYTAKIVTSTLPKGYAISNESNAVSLTSQIKSVQIAVPSSIIEETMPSGHRYSLGSVAYDFTTTAVGSNGANKTISLSSYLSVYKAVVLNFWFGSCGPCLSEFPHMNEAYIDYSDKIALIAIDNGSDSAEDVNAFVAKNGYKFDFVNDESMFSYYNAYGATAFPTTVVIDRYGAVSAIDAGSRPSVSAWTSLFDYYLSDDYVPDYTSNHSGEEVETPDAGATKPNVEMPDSADIAATVTGVNTLTTKQTFTYLPYDDPYSWPWVLAEKDGQACLKTSNAQRVNSYSILVIDVSLKAGQQLFFDYFVSTELETDLLYVQVDTVLQYALSGEDNAWNTDKLLYVARRDGKYQITLTYQKSALTNAGDDTVYIKNLRIEQGKAITGHYDLLYNAVDNYTLDANATVPGAYKGFLNHVPYYFSTIDGFYHVAITGSEAAPSASDPILLADLYYETPWNSISVWMLAYAQYGIFNPADLNYKEGYSQAIEDYSWLQQNSTSRYVPLNKELHDILVDVATYIGRKDHTSDPHKGVDQWLEMCRYYVNYGTPAANETCYSVDNTVEALKWRTAKDYGEVSSENVVGNEKVVHVDVYSLHLPRGNYYKFTAKTSGVYLIRSVVPNASDYDVNAVNPLGFLCDANGNILEENDDFVIETQGVDSVGNPLYDNNFYIYFYLRENETYYVGGCFNDPYATGEYDVTVTYIGEEYSYFTSCAVDTTYTYDEDSPTFTPYIRPKMGKDAFFVGEDGNYYAQEADGSKGSLIYIRLIGPTFFNGYTSYTLEQMIENDMLGATLEERLYVKDLLISARTTYAEDHELYGYVPASEKLVSIVNALANSGDEDDATYSSTSWLLTAYYYRNINELTLDAAQSKYQK